MLAQLRAASARVIPAKLADGARWFYLEYRAALLADLGLRSLAVLYLQLNRARLQDVLLDIL
jgi:hypothetical protein